MGRQTVVLFGAGASMDADLPDAFQLTQRIYDKLVSAKSDDAHLFGLIVSKLLVRHVRRGGSPYDSINVEDAYDALKRFINRDSDLLSEFVQGWDPMSTGSARNFDAQNFAQNLAQSFQLEQRHRLDGSVSFRVNQSNIVSLTENLQRAFGGDFYRLEGASLEPFLTTLSVILEAPDEKLGYMRHLLKLLATNVACIATLNYDRVVEKSFELDGEKFDLGLSQWNEKRIVKFHGQSTKIVKLHGSVDWFLRNEDEVDVSPGPVGVYPRRAMIFGGQNEKLVPYGPFLHLRHEFQTMLRQSSSLLVVGYSFRDSHLNAIIRSWIAKKKRAKMMVVNPAGFSEKHPIMRYSPNNRKPDKSESAVDLTVIEKRTSSSLDAIKSFLNAR